MDKKKTLLGMTLSAFPSYLPCLFSSQHQIKYMINSLRVGNGSIVLDTHKPPKSHQRPLAATRVRAGCEHAVTRKSIQEDLIQTPIQQLPPECSRCRHITNLNPEPVPEHEGRDFSAPSGRSPNQTNSRGRREENNRGDVETLSVELVRSVNLQRNLP